MKNLHEDSSRATYIQLFIFYLMVLFLLLVLFSSFSNPMVAWYAKKHRSSPSDTWSLGIVAAGIGDPEYSQRALN